jgi:hypothetical protein
MGRLVHDVRMMAHLAAVSEPRESSIERRLAAVRELMIPVMREDAGLHDFDGVVQDLSETGVSSALGALQPSSLPKRARRLPSRHDLLVAAGLDEPPAVEPAVHAPADPLAHDDLQLQIAESALRWFYGDYQAHRRDPRLHLANLDLSCYDRDYAPEADRADAKARHLAIWPEAIDVAVATLDAVPAPVAAALVGSARGLAQPLNHPGEDGPIAPAAVIDAALLAHARLVTHLERLALEGPPETAIGPAHLAQFMGAFDGLTINMPALADCADAERDRVRALLAQRCAQVDPHRPTREVVRTLLLDHPAADQVLAAARRVSAESIEFTRAHELVPWVDGECLVGPAPAARSWAPAMVSWAGPYEDDAPSWYYVTPPDPRWPHEQIQGWLTIFGATTLPAITVHEVAPGHFAHGRCLRRVTSPVRRQVQSLSFIEGWAHYGEEMMVEAGFRADDPRFAIGVYLGSLIRTTRLVCAIGLHTGLLNVEEAARMFERDAFMTAGPAHSEAARGTFDAGYGHYALGKLEILRLRSAARSEWGSDFSLQRFHSALLELGAPPLALMRSILR